MSTTTGSSRGVDLCGNFDEETILFVGENRQVPAFTLPTSESDELTFMSAPVQLMTETEQPRLPYKVRKCRAKNARRAAKRAQLTLLDEQIALARARAEAAEKSQQKKRQRAETRARHAAKIEKKIQRVRADAAKTAAALERQYLACQLPFWQERRLESTYQRWSAIGKAKRFQRDLSFTLPVTNRFDGLSVESFDESWLVDEQPDRKDRRAIAWDLKQPLSAHKTLDAQAAAHQAFRQQTMSDDRYDAEDRLLQSLYYRDGFAMLSDPEGYRVGTDGVTYFNRPCAAFSWPETMQILARLETVADIKDFLGNDDLVASLLAEQLQQYWSGPEGNFIYPCGENEEAFRLEYCQFLHKKMTRDQRKKHRHLRRITRFVAYQVDDDIWFLDEEIERVAAERAEMVNEDLEFPGSRCRVIRHRRRCQRAVVCPKCNRCAIHCYRFTCQSMWSDRWYDQRRHRAREAREARLDTAFDNFWNVIMQAHGDATESIPSGPIQGFLGKMFDVKLEHNFDQDQLMSMMKPLFLEVVGPALAEKWERIIADFIHLVVLILTSKYNWATVVTGISWFLSHHARSFSVIKVVDSVKDWWSPPKSGPVQGNFTEESLAWLAPFGALGLTLFGILTVSKLPKGSEVSDFIQRFSRVGAMVKSLETLMEYGGNLGRMLADAYRRWFLGYSVEDLDGWKAIDKWCAQACLFNTSDLRRKLQEDPKLIATLNSLIIQGDQHIKTLDSLSVPAAQRVRVQNTWMFLKEAKQLAAEVDSGELRSRSAPIVVHIYGDTGTGKSTTLPFLQADILSALGCTDPKDLEDKVYYRFPANEFFDGLKNGTEIFVCDDFGAVRDTIMRPAPEALEIIRLNNTAPFQPPMAHLSAKGNVLAEPSIILLTTNRWTFKFDSLTNDEAVLRRISLKFRQHPAPGYEKKVKIGGKDYVLLDGHKVAQEAKEDPTVYRRCVLYDLMENDYTAQIVKDANLSFDEMSSLVCEATLKAKREGLAVVNAAKKYFLARGKTQGADDQPSSSRGSPTVKPLCEYTEAELLEALGDPEFKLDMPKTHRVRRSWMDIITGGNIHVDVPATIAGIGWVRHEPLKQKTHWKPDEDWGRLYEASCIVVSADKMGPHLTCALRMAHTAVKRCRVNQKEKFCEIMTLYLGPYPSDIYKCQQHESRFDSCCSWMKEETPIGKAVSWFEDAWIRFQEGCARLMERIYASPLLSTLFMAFVTMLLTFAGGLGMMAGFDWYLNRGLKKKEEAKRTKKTAAAESVSQQTATAAAVKVESVNDKAMAAKTVKVESVSAQTSTAKVGQVECIDRPVEKCLGWMAPPEICPPEHRPEVRDGVTHRRSCPNGCTRHKRVIEIEDDTNIEAVSDQNSLEVVKKCAKNSYVLERQIDGVWRHTLNVTILAGRIALANRHLDLFKAKNWRIRNAFNPIGYEFILDECPKSYPDSDGPHSKKDSMLFELPRQVPLHPDITNLFFTSADMSRHRTLQGGAVAGAGLLKFKKDLEVPIMIYAGTNVVKAMDSEFMLTHDSADVGRVRDYYLHMVPTTAGDCGSVFIAVDSNYDRKIVGIHAAGAPLPYTGVVTPTTQEFISHLMSKLDVRYRESKIATNLQASESIHMEVDGEELSFPRCFSGFVPIGTASQGAFSPKESNIHPSPVHGMIQEPLTKPAYLRPIWVNGEKVDPEVLGRSKAAGPSFVVEEAVLAAATNDLRQKICRNVLPSDRVMLTFEEAIMGREGDDFIQPVNRRSSPGYGWKKIGRGKTHYLGHDDYILDHTEVVEVYEKMLAQCKRGERPCVIWQDTLKDERRPIAKVNQGKTRLFAAGEMVFTILFRQYFAPICAHMARNRIDVESCIGVNPYSKDWDYLARVLQQVGPHVIAGDFSNYDGSLLAQILWAILDDVIEPFYAGSEEDKTIRRALWCEIVNSIHISGKTLYMWTHSQPSGCPATAIINSLYHSVSARIVWILCARKHAPEMVSLHKFAECVRHVNYGDDDVWNIHPSVIAWFNQVTITEAYATFGMTYTDEAKSGRIVEYRSLGEVNFLKRGFRWDKEAARYRAPLAVETILEMPMWTHGTNDQWSVVASTLDMAAYEAAQFNRSEFAELLRLMEPARQLVNERVPCTFLTYDAYQEQEWRKYVAGVV